MNSEIEVKGVFPPPDKEKELKIYVHTLISVEGTSCKSLGKLK